MLKHRSVVIVDDDLGFVAWLGVTLTAANGFVTVPATTLQTAERLVADLHVPSIDLAIVNLGLAGTADFVKMLRRVNPALKVIAIEDGPSIARPREADAVRSRSETHWLTTVERVLSLRNPSGGI